MHSSALVTHWLTDCGTVEWLLPIYTAHYFSYCCMLTPKAHLLLHMDVVTSRVKGRGEEVTWSAYTKPKFTAMMASAEEKHWEAFANRTRNSTAPSAEGGASTGGTVGGRRDMPPSKGNTIRTGSGCAGEGLLNFTKRTQNGLLKCSQCRRYIQGPSHKWMPYPGAGCHGPGRYYCHVTKKRGWEAWC